MHKKIRARFCFSCSDSRETKIENLKSGGFFAIVVMLLGWSGLVEAQQAKKVFRIGYLSTTDAASDSYRSKPLRATLRELGYTEGQNITIEYRYAEGKRDRLPELAAELVRLKVEIILVAGGDTAIRPAVDATKTIPIVLTGLGSDPVKGGFVESLARPGGNVTGFTFLTTELGGKRLELLKEAVTNLARLAVLYEPSAVGFTRELKVDLPVAACALGLIVDPWEIRDEDGFERVFAALNKQRPDGLYAPSAGALMTANQKRIAGFALKSRLPSMYTNRAAVEDGGLMSYAADRGDSYRRITYFVDRILKGAKPAELPIEQPTKFELVINLKTANQLGLTIPPNVLARADKVIKEASAKAGKR